MIPEKDDPEAINAYLKMLKEIHEISPSTTPKKPNEYYYLKQ